MPVPAPVNILDRIVRTKHREVRELGPRHAELARLARSAPPPRDFRSALGGSSEVAIVAEVKRRSPGAGPIREDLDPSELAADYAASGASAISVLTDRTYFGGGLEDLRRVRARVERPVLRKDFLVDPVQLAESRAEGADAVLLIVRILTDQLLEELLRGARALGMAALVEVHDGAELDRALEAGADIVGINNRDLGTFRSSVAVTLDLVRRIPSDVVVVSESGLATRDDLAAVGGAGADAVLMGEALLRSPRPGDAVAALTGVPCAPRAAGTARAHPPPTAATRPPLGPPDSSTAAARRPATPPTPTSAAATTRPASSRRPARTRDPRPPLNAERPHPTRPGSPATAVGHTAPVLPIAPSPMPEVKICGITRPEDGRVAARAGATYVGTVLTPGFARSVDIPTARAVAEAADIPLVILLVDPTLDEAVLAARETGAAVVQLHGREDPEIVSGVRARGSWAVWKATPVRDAADAAAALDRYGAAADGLLFDGWHGKLPGGTGTRFPWTSLADVRERLVPGQRLVVAGGLNADNVTEAISILRPDVVDASSGVEARVRVKDPAKVRGFVRAARGNGGDS